jgi:ABC-type multidrug transport system ATPase subunit
MPAIEIRHVTKHFGSVAAVDDVTLDVPEGSIYGFIGPNGSGKTTTIRMIMNILAPERGEIAVVPFAKSVHQLAQRLRRHFPGRVDATEDLPMKRQLHVACERFEIVGLLRHNGIR